MNESRTVAVWTSVCQRFICMQKHPFIILNGNRTICLALHYFLNSSWLALFSNVYVTQSQAAFNKSMCALQKRVLHYIWRFPLGNMEMCPLVCSSTGENYHGLSILERFEMVRRTKILLWFTHPHVVPNLYDFILGLGIDTNFSNWFSLIYMYLNISDTVHAFFSCGNKSLN